MDEELDSDALVVSDADAGQRLDKILASLYAGRYSRTYLQWLIDQGRVRVNEEPIKKRYLATAGDKITIFFLTSPEIALKPEPIPLAVLYEDECLLAVNKPPGLVVHPAPGHWTGTFVHALLHHCQGDWEWEACLDPFTSRRPGIVHRLDKDTSGVLLAAKTPLVQQKLAELFAERKIEKEYLAICLGNPGEGTIDIPIARHPRERKKMVATREGGKEAISIFYPLQTEGPLTYLRVLLKTGRTHQIRVHLKHQGTPILGDHLYGNQAMNRHFGAMRQMLHAHRISFSHPLTGQLIQVTAPLPDDFVAILEKHLGTVWRDLVPTGSQPAA